MAWTTPGTAVAGDVLTAAFWNLNVRDDLNYLYSYGSPFASAWTTYNSPTQSGWSLGNGTIAARYFRSGSVCCYTGQITFGSTTSISGSFRIGLPFTGSIRNATGTALLMDGTTPYHGFCFIDNAIDANLLGIFRSGGASAAAYVGSTTPFTWGSGDYLAWTIFYEIAP